MLRVLRSVLITILLIQACIMTYAAVQMMDWVTNYGRWSPFASILVLMALLAPGDILFLVRCLRREKSDPDRLVLDHIEVDFDEKPEPRWVRPAALSALAFSLANLALMALMVWRQNERNLFNEPGLALIFFVLILLAIGHTMLVLYNWPKRAVGAKA
jgi:hypothetical protein